MEKASPVVRRAATDRRSWGVTLVLVGWIALGMLTQVDVLAESSTPIIYGYLFVLSAFVGDLPGGVPFWVGLGVFCFAIASVLVALFDEIRDRRASAESGDRNPTE